MSLLCQLHFCLPVLAREGLTHSSVSVLVITPGVLYLFVLAKKNKQKTQTKTTKQKMPQLAVCFVIPYRKFSTRCLPKLVRALESETFLPPATQEQTKSKLKVNLPSGLGRS